MEKVNQEMTREAWLAWRHERLGASDANMMMGRSQYGTRQDLINAKAFPLVIKSQPWLEKEKGDGEKEAVEMFCSSHNISPCRKVQHQFLLSCKWHELHMEVSCSLDAMIEELDGYEGESRFVGLEVKCVEEASEGCDVPPQYYWQLLQQDMLLFYYTYESQCGFNCSYKLFYVEYSKKQKKLLKVVQFQGKHARSILADAYIDLCKEIEETKKRGAVETYVAEGTKVRLYELTDKYNALLPELEKAKSAYDSIDKQAKAIREQISSLVGKQAYEYVHEGLKVSKVRVQGRIDTDKIPLEIPLHTLRGEDTFMLKITKNKDQQISEKLSFSKGKMEIK